MLLTLHGTGAGTPGAGRSSSAVTLRFSDGRVVLLDAGEGCARALVRDGVDLNRIEAVAISHMHADHWSGLPGLIIGWGTLDRGGSDVEVYAPSDALEFLRTAQTQSLSFPERLAFEMRWRSLAPFEAGEGWYVEPFATTHLDTIEALAREHGASTPAHGYILRNGERRIVLSQDIGSADDLAPHVAGAELLVCETSHVEVEAVLSIAAEAGLGLVVFTHVSPKRAVFPTRTVGVPWVVASDGMMLGIPEHRIGLPGKDGAR